MIHASDIPSRTAFRLCNANVPGCLLEPASVAELVRVDIAVADGRIAAVQAVGELAPAHDGIDLDRSMVWPGLVDVHTHLDKGHIWPRTQNPDGTFLDALTASAEDRRRYWTAEDVARRMDFSLRCAYAHGTVAIRTHLNSEPPQDAVSWPVFCDMRRRWAGRIHLQPVCLIGLEKMVEPLGSQLADLVAQSEGVLGVITDASSTLETDLRRVFRLARERRLDLDFHADESLNRESRSLDLIADLAMDFPGKVHAGHCCSLSVQADEVAAPTL
ncbi:MAG: cytosine deaminase, partial [Candidatus Tectomicrobia bacterium]|nr:cytosine deaminase [Candidatus Tectomicrobia bacterium]